jgi:hypothetical protein
MRDKHKTFDFTGTMLDIPEFAESEVQKHPISSLPGRSSERAKTGNQYPGSRNFANAFHYYGLNIKKIFIRLKGITISPNGFKGI